MHASTGELGFFINPSLEDDNATSLEIKPLKQERKATEKEAVHGNAAQGSNCTLLTLVITVCLISLAVLLLTLLMLFGKIGDGYGCSADKRTKNIEKNATFEISADSAKIKALEGNIRSLQLGLTERLDDLAEFNNTLIKQEYLDAVLTGLKSALNKTNTDLAELKSIQTKEKVIYHQTMTPSWLVAHASYISIYRLNTTEQLEFIAGPSQDFAALLKVPMIPANVLQNSTQVTVKIVVCNDVDIGTNEDSDPKYGISDGISFVGFETPDKANYNSRPPCFGRLGTSGTSVSRGGWIGALSSRPSDSFFPGQFVITLKLDAYKSWGSCYTAHDGGFVKTAVYNNRLVLSKGLTLEVYKDNKEERVGIKFIEVTVVEDV